MNNINLKQAYDLFIFDRQTFCQEKTVENYQNTIRYFMDYLEEYRGLPADHIYLEDILNDDIKRYVIMLRKRTANENHPLKKAKGRLSQRTIRNYTVDLKTFFSFLQEQGFSDNKFTGVKIIKPEKKVIVPLFLDDVKVLDKNCNTKTHFGCRNYCIVHLMLDAGLRSQEVRTLEVQDVLFHNSCVHIRHGKGSKERTVPMSGNLKTQLYAYIHVYRKFEKEVPFVFADGEGSCMSEDALKSLFSRLKRKTGIFRLHPHLLRHTFATCYILGGGSVEMLRILLGHEDLETTQIYMHLASVYGFENNMYQLDSIFFRNRKL